MLSKKKWAEVFVVACFFSFACLVADNALAVEKGIYFRGGAGFLFFNPPDRDSFPFHEFSATSGAIDGRNQSPLEFEPQDTTAAWNVALGYRFDPSVTPKCIGANPRVEFSSNFYFPEDSETRSPLKPKGTGGGILGGAFYNQNGLKGVALLGGDLPSTTSTTTTSVTVFDPTIEDFITITTTTTQVIPGIDSVPDIRFTADYDYVDFNLGIRTDYTLVKNRFFLSPYVGAIYAILDQRFTISAETPSDLVAAPLWPYGKHEYRVTENLETHYFGATFGLDFIVRIIEGLTFSLGGAISPLYADTDMDIKSRGTMWTPTNPRVGTSTKVDDGDGTFTFRAMGKAELAYRIGWFKAAVLGMVDYWDYVPVVEYPEYSSGDWGVFTPGTYPSDVPGLDDGNMTNWILMFTATILLPWP